MSRLPGLAELDADAARAALARVAAHHPRPLRMTHVVEMTSRGLIAHRLAQQLDGLPGIGVDG